MWNKPTVLVGCAFVAACAAPADPLRAELEALAEGFAPREVAIAYEDLATGARTLVHGDLELHAASTMKVPVMVELYRQADSGERSLDHELVLANAFRSIVDGSPYSLGRADDSDAALYELVGHRVTVRELCVRMIARSSNLATNALIELVDPRRVQATVESLGTTRMQVRRGVEDQKAFDRGLSNTTTARDLLVVMAALARGLAASREACREMVAILGLQEHRDLIPAGLPPGTMVAHKTGSITRILHDAAIVDPHGARPYVLVVLTRGFDDEVDGARAIARVASVVHTFHVVRGR
jgi:beta-lactamase class A